MTINITSPVTGTAQTGFTAPTYTLTADTPISVNSKQYAVTGIGGTQTGVDLHSVSKPFTISVFRPKELRSLPMANPITGVIKNIPVNTYKIIVRKGVLPASNQSLNVALVKIEVNVPAGSDTNEPEDLKAMLSLAFGAASQISAGFGDTILSGVM